MDLFKSKNIDFIRSNKWLLIPSIPLVLFILLIYLSRPSQNGQIQNQAPVKNSSDPSSVPTPQTYGENQIEELENRPDIVKKEVLPQGATRYTLTSPNPQRPNIFITIDHGIVFERSVVSPDFPLSITEYGDSQPEMIIKGSRFYGADKETCIYSTKGLTLIIDPSTNLILEQHFFTPMSTETYIRIYGEDLTDPSNQVSKILPTGIGD